MADFIEKEHFINLPVFGYYFYIVVTTDVIASRKSRNDILGKVDESKPPSVAMCSQGEGEKCSYYSYIFLKPDASAGNISHEVYHAICNMFHYIGAEHEDEILAYHIGYLVDEIEKLKAIKLGTRKEKKS